MYKFVKIFLILIFLGIFTSQATASEFQFDYDVYYNVENTGKTAVKYDITITNLVSNYYTQNFSFNFASDRIQNIRAIDSAGEIKPEVKNNNNKTTITINFNEKVVGLGKQMRFSVWFDSFDIAGKKGSIWEVIIPGIEKDASMNSYNVHLSVPEIFGKPAVVMPQPNNQGIWTLNELKNGGINLIYGDRQIYAFNLSYDLINNSAISQIQEIALPPDNAYQKIILSDLSEIPEDVDIDQDGNWMAKYRLKPKENKKIIVTGKLLVSYQPDVSKSKVLTSNEISLYTQSLTFWENNSQITEIAKNLTTPREIYNWGVDNLTYNYDFDASGSARNGAAYILEHPNEARCMDFSDLFVALARSNGIPAREIHGFAFTTNSKLQPLSTVSDVLHAWVEYYDSDKKNWIAVDPTWSNTTNGVDYFDKLDFNHVTLAILGINSNYPYPAGSFYQDNPQKNVFIDFSKNDVSIPTPVSKITLKQPQVFAGINNKVKLTIANNGQILLDEQPLKFNISDINDGTIDVERIPPFGSSEVTMDITPKISLIKNAQIVDIEYNNQQFPIEIMILPIYLLGYPFTLGFLICGIILAYIIYVNHKSKKSSPPSASTSGSLVI